MNHLSKIFIFKITATVFAWCIPLILLPSSWLQGIGLPRQDTYMFVRMLGWAYLALCVGYGFGLVAALRGEKAMGPIWMGIVSNGGALLFLLYYGLRGTWTSWGPVLQLIGWGSVVATFIITFGLLHFGVRGR